MKCRMTHPNVFRTKFLACDRVSMSSESPNLYPYVYVQLQLVHVIRTNVREVPIRAGHGQFSYPSDLRSRVH